MVFVQAQLGVSMDKMDSRFGDNIQKVDPLAPATVSRVYRYEDLIVAAGFMKNECCYVIYKQPKSEYRKRSQKMDLGSVYYYEKSPQYYPSTLKKQETEFSEGQMMSFLNENSEGATWQEVAETTDRKVWERSDGKAFAGYNKQEKSLIIHNRAWNRERPFLNDSTDDQVEKKSKKVQD